MWEAQEMNQKDAGGHYYIRNYRRLVTGIQTSIMIRRIIKRIREFKTNYTICQGWSWQDERIRARSYLQ